MSFAVFLGRIRRVGKGKSLRDEASIVIVFGGEFPHLEGVAEQGMLKRLARFREAAEGRAVVAKTVESWLTAHWGRKALLIV